MPETPSVKAPGLPRIIAAVIYDWLILLGLLMLAGFIAVGVNKWITGQDAISSGNPLFALWNLAIVYAYFAGFWQTKRQTVGMRAWRMHIEASEHPPLGWKHCTVRFLAAIPSWGLLLMGVFWRYTNAQREAWHDRASATRLVYTPKPKRTKKPAPAKTEK